MRLTNLDQHHWETGDRIVVIETPRDSRVKIDYDPKRNIFHVHHLLAAGLAFPADFGFIPRTKAADGDPLDVLVLSDQPGYPGLVLSIRLLGVLEAEQTEKSKTFRNDRLIARAVESFHFGQAETLSDLSKEILDQFENFFVTYNRLRGKKFRPLNRAGKEQAEKLIRKASI